jgi:hypothetical protein
MQIILLVQDRLMLLCLVIINNSFQRYNSFNQYKITRIIIILVIKTVNIIIQAIFNLQVYRDNQQLLDLRELEANKNNKSTVQELGLNHLTTVLQIMSME